MSQVQEDLQDVVKDLLKEKLSLNVDKSEFTFMYRLLLLCFIAIFVSILIVNSTLYSALFPEENEASDFTSKDIPFPDRLSLIMRYIAVFVSFFVIIFLLIICFLYVVMLVIVSAKTADMNKAFTLKNKYVIAHLQKLYWNSNKSTSMSVYTWILIAILFYMLVFLIYVICTKSFLSDMKFPSYKDPEAETDDDEANAANGKNFIVFYGLLCILIIILGMMLTTINKSFVFIIVHSMILGLFLLMMIYIFANKMKNRNAKWILMLIFYILVVCLMHTSSIKNFVKNATTI